MNHWFECVLTHLSYQTMISIIGRMSELFNSESLELNNSDIALVFAPINSGVYLYLNLPKPDALASMRSDETVGCYRKIRWNLDKHLAAIASRRKRGAIWQVINLPCARSENTNGNIPFNQLDISVIYLGGLSFYTVCIG